MLTTNLASDQLIRSDFRITPDGCFMYFQLEMEQSINYVCVDTMRNQFFCVNSSPNPVETFTFNRDFSTIFINRHLAIYILFTIEERQKVSLSNYLSYRKLVYQNFIQCWLHNLIM